MNMTIQVNLYSQTCTMSGHRLSDRDSERCGDGDGIHADDCQISEDSGECTCGYDASTHECRDADHLHLVFETESDALEYAARHFNSPIADGGFNYRVARAIRGECPSWNTPAEEEEDEESV